MVSCTPAFNLKANNGEMEITREKIEGEAPLPSCQMPGQGATEGKGAFETTSLNRIMEALEADTVQSSWIPVMLGGSAILNLPRATRSCSHFNCDMKDADFFFFYSLFHFSHFCMISNLPKTCASINERRN